MNNNFQSVEEIEKGIFARYPKLSVCEHSIHKAYEILCSCYRENKRVYIAGNGGSAADSEHIVGELMKSFMAHRKTSPKFANLLADKFGDDGIKLANELEGGIPAVSLVSMISISTAIMNDSVPENVFAQLVMVLGTEQDVFLGISTSGNSANIVKAAMVAKAKNMQVISLCGQKEAKLDDVSDVVIHVPEVETYKIQELHLPVYHALCAMLESYFFGEK